MAYHVSKQRFEELVELALAELPEQFAKALDEVRIEIRDDPSPRQIEQMKLSRGTLLLGLYQCHPLTKRSVEDLYRFPERIYIFQQPIEQVCGSEQQLITQVRKTVLHEIGHHFGMSEADLDALGYG
jgi:predicted Zn-dependent protease with MMP-like domain